MVISLHTHIEYEKFSFLTMKFEPILYYWNLVLIQQKNKIFKAQRRCTCFTQGTQRVSTGLMQTSLHGFANDSKSSGMIIVINWTVSQNKETDYLPLQRRITRELSLPCSQAPSVGATVMIR